MESVGLLFPPVNLCWFVVIIVFRGLFSLGVQGPHMGYKPQVNIGNDIKKQNI